MPGPAAEQPPSGAVNKVTGGILPASRVAGGGVGAESPGWAGDSQPTDRGSMPAAVCDSCCRPADTGSEHSGPPRNRTDMMSERGLSPMQLGHCRLSGFGVRVGRKSPRLERDLDAADPKPTGSGLWWCDSERISDLTGPSSAGGVRGAGRGRGGQAVSGLTVRSGADPGRFAPELHTSKYGI